MIRLRDNNILLTSRSYPLIAKYGFDLRSALFAQVSLEEQKVSRTMSRSTDLELSYKELFS